MSEAIAFDTHGFVKRLMVNGFTEQQAETLAAEHVNLLNGNLATKTDIEQMRLETKAEIAAAKASILKWMIGALIAQSGVIAALIQLSA